MVNVTKDSILIKKKFIFCSEKNKKICIFWGFLKKKQKSKPKKKQTSITQK